MNPLCGKPATELSRLLSSGEISSEELTRAHLERIAKAFAQEELDLMVLKGMWLQAYAYRDPDDRPFGDLDLLVRRAERDVAGALLTSLGYRLQIDAPGDVARLYVSSDGFQIDLNPAVTISLFPFYANQTRREAFNVAAYDRQTHPDGTQALEINGYTTGTYFDPARSGEGLFWEVAERGDGTRFAFFSWFTYAPDGRPTWIIGNVDVPVGARTILVPTFSFTGGGFAGNFNPANIVSRPWGNVSFAFPDCNTLALTFASTHSDANVPTGDGQRLWSRLSSINGFVCQ